MAGSTKYLNLLRAALFLATGALGALQAYAHRDHAFQEDAICYLDLSDAILQGKLGELADPHWSPLYPSALALFRVLFNPSPYWEPAVLKLTNFGLFVLVAVAFGFFISAFLKARQVRAASRTPEQGIELPASLLVGVLYLWFWWACLSMNGVHHDTPDLMVSGFVLAASTIVLAMGSGVRSRRYDVMLGLVLGVGCLAKSTIFPLSAVYLTMSCVPTSEGFIKTAKGALVSFAVYCLFAVPYLALISMKAGHLTFSQSGKLSYACYIEQRYQDHNPQGVELVHPTRRLQDCPLTYEFAAPIGGTYPPWYGMTYWFKGATASFHPRVFLAVLLNLYCYCVWFAGPLLVAVVLQYVVCRNPVVTVGSMAANWRLFVPALVGLALFLPVTLLPMFGETRRVGVFALLIVAGLLSGMRLSTGRRNRIGAAILIAAVILTPLPRLIERISGDLALAAAKPSYVHWKIAQGLRGYGLKPGDLVCQLGLHKAEGRVDPVCPLYYWARLARLKIAADVIDEEEFWAAGAKLQAELFDKLKAKGIKAVVLGPTGRLPQGGLPPGWRKVDGVDTYLYRLDPDTDPETAPGPK